MKATLDAIYGEKATVMDHSCWPVLVNMAADRDEDAYDGRFHGFYQKRMADRSR